MLILNPLLKKAALLALAVVSFGAASAHAETIRKARYVCRTEPGAMVMITENSEDGENLKVNYMNEKTMIMKDFKVIRAEADEKDPNFIHFGFLVSAENPVIENVKGALEESSVLCKIKLKSCDSTALSWVTVNTQNPANSQIKIGEGRALTMECQTSLDKK